jgi:hypothetical protein
MHRIFLTASFCLAFIAYAGAIGDAPYVDGTRHRGGFTIASHGDPAPIYVEKNDYWGVNRAAHDLQADLARVTGRAPSLIEGQGEPGERAIIVGTIGKSALIDALVSSGKLDVVEIKGKWETFLMQVVPHPLKGIRSALVIAGSDKRGTIYGIYDLSEQIGVSPWYWWADVPIAHRDALFVKAGRHVQGPAVKYRGIFLNDEAPALTGWVKEKYGGYNHQFYEKVFELLLRLKANYLWPAMWDSAFNADDPLNPKLADQYGIVMGTSHHEPMMRAWKEWARTGKGPWDYSSNASALHAYWTEGVERDADYESIVTLGMRGDGDLPMSEGDNVNLLEKIVADQRDIVRSVKHVDPATVPQDWALYKEVQQYYEHGMRVPDDVTLLWCDDNWGNIRRLPTEEERKRAGGAGIYYHFDYVGDPRSYKWINTNPLPKIWEQMNLAYRYDATRIWIVNVGDLKPMELPIEFFLNLAWNPSRWTSQNIGEFTRLWAKREFGSKYADEIADIVERYAKYNARRKPELLAPDTYSLVNYDEADRILADFRSIAESAEKISARLPEEMRDAFFELVLYPAKASALVADLYITVGKNRLFATQLRAGTNDFAAAAKKAFSADADLAGYYNHTLARGKWNHMMDQSHIGYTGWKDPPANVMPEVSEITVPEAASMGIAIEGSSSAWPGASEELALPEIDALNRQPRYIDVFDRGQSAFEFTASASDPWIVLSATHGSVQKEQRLWVSIDWEKAPAGSHSGFVTIAGTGATARVKVEEVNHVELPRAPPKGFVEGDGYVSIEAEHYTRKIDDDSVQWQRVNDYGRTLSAMTIFPVTAKSVLLPASAACLEYEMYLFSPGEVDVDALLAPTLDFAPGRGLRFGTSFDDQPRQVVDALADKSNSAWETSVKDSIRKIKTHHVLTGTGYHTLKFCMVDPGVVLEKLVVDLGGVRPSYLGPPESYRAPNSATRNAHHDDDIGGVLR